MSKIGEGLIIGKNCYGQGLASNNYQTMSGTIDSTAWIAFDSAYGEEIKPFTTCVYDSSTGKLIPFDADLHQSRDVYLLVDWVYELNTSGDQICSVFETATLYYGAVVETDTVVWSENTRFIIRPQEV